MSKRIVSFGARILRRWLVDDGVHDSGCTLRIYRRECFDGLELYGELHRMIPALLKWRGFVIKEVKVNHRARKTGVTKYGWKRTVKGFLDMMGVWFWRKYESRPLHLFGTMGLVLVTVSSMVLVWLALARWWLGYQLSDKIWPLMAVTGLLTGIQLVVTGLLADMIVKGQSGEKKYLVKEVSENE